MVRLALVLLVLISSLSFVGCATKVCEDGLSCYRLGEELNNKKEYQPAKESYKKGCDLYKYADSCQALVRSPFYSLSPAEKDSYRERSCEYGLNTDCESLWMPTWVHVDDGKIPGVEKSRNLLDRVCKRGKPAACIELATISQFTDPEPFQNHDEKLDDICKKRMPSDDGLRYRACAMHSLPRIKSLDKKTAETALLTLKFNCMSANSSAGLPVCLINEQKAVTLMQAANCTSTSCAEYNHALGVCGLLKKPDIVKSIDKNFENPPLTRATGIVLDIRKHCGLSGINIAL